MSIWNNSTNQYEAITGQEHEIKEKIDQYISEGREILILLQVGANADESLMHIPSVEVKGVAKE